VIQYINDEKGTDPGWKPLWRCSQRIFKEILHERLVIRERKIDPVILFWVSTLGFGVRFLSTIRGLKRRYEEKAGVKLSISSFYDRFTPKISFGGACSMQLSFEHSNPVVSWAIN